MGDNMERELCLVLDENYSIRLPLAKGTGDEIDKYTIKFDNATNLRKKHQKEINEFLKEHQYFLDARDPEKKNFYGRIVVLEKIDEKYEERMVLFKKHLVAFRNYIYKNTATMQEFARIAEYFNKKRMISPFLARQIGYNGTFSVKSRLEKVKRDLNKNIYFYDILRIIIRCYKQQRELKPNLPTIEYIYSEYLESRKTSKNIENIDTPIENSNAESSSTIEIEDEKETTYIINGSKYSADEIHLFDIDDIDMESSELIPDVLGRDGNKHI